MGTIQQIALTFSITSSFFKVLSKAKDKYPDFKYIDILNSQLQSFQLKFTERLENRLSSKTIKVLLSNRKLTGRKRIAFDNNVHKIAIAGSSTCSTKELSIHLTKTLSAVKEGQQKYCETVYSRSGINHMWILKNSIVWITLNQDLSLRHPPSNLLIFRLYIPPYRMTN